MTGEFSKLRTTRAMGESAKKTISQTNQWTSLPTQNDNMQPNVVDHTETKTRQNLTSTLRITSLIMLKKPFPP